MILFFNLNLSVFLMYIELDLSAAFNLIDQQFFIKTLAKWSGLQSVLSFFYQNLLLIVRNNLS